MSAPVRTTCPYCGTGCGVAVSPSANGGWSIDGDAKHPANFGKLCAKGSALAETLGPEARLLYPEIAGKRASWDQALDLIARRFEDIAQAHGPELIAFYLSGQLLTEDYYVANKLAKGFIGTPHVDTNSRLCMASSVAGHKRAFGSDTVPGCYEDLDMADLIVLVGSNTAWNHPILFQRMLASKRERGARIVAIDVRETTTTAACDLALSILPGSDSWLFNGLLAYLAANGALDKDYIESYTTGFYAALAAARSSAPDVRAVARATGLTVSRLRRFYEMFAGAARTVTCYSQGINQSSSGTDKVNAIINCHLATGRIGKPGAGPLSLTGQPNAMGGREVGGLANQLAAHMDFDAAARRPGRPVLECAAAGERPGLKAVEMFDALHEGRIKAMWVLCTNPAVSLPNAERVTGSAKALRTPRGVGLRQSHNDTIAHAHVRLPAARLGREIRHGDQFRTAYLAPARVSKRRAGRRSQIGGSLAELPAVWVSKQAFNYASSADVFREHAALYGFRERRQPRLRSYGFRTYIR